MLRTPLVVALLGVGAAAQAQNVTLYGIMDVGVEHLTHVNAQGDSLTRMPNLTGTVPSRIGVRGTEDLGGGWQALFNLESGIALKSGGLNNGGRMWGRAAYVGAAGPFGRLTLGRQVNMTVLAVSSHVMGPALYSFASHDPYIPNAISDNALGYLGTFSGVTVGATYSLGRDTASIGGPAATSCPGEAADSRQCRQWTALLKYDAPSFGVAASHDVMHGGPGAAFGMTSSDHTDERTVVSAWRRVGGVKVSGGVLHRKRDNVARLVSNLVYAGASVPVTAALTADMELSKLDVRSSPNDSTMVVLRGVYALSKRTAIYAMAGHLRNEEGAAVSLSAGGTVGVGMSQSGVMAGIRHTF
ncbi:porin [Piscinibacter sp. XHJ-5]|uniref:porin n=1 Tax=Piscinibacter sp. XHJ-5 TaxID=3037797 RepID=UPI0024531CAB|nr:porin [Piscinibacter sp. XHJ-5]